MLFNSAYFRIYLWLRSHCILFVCLILYWYCAYMMLPKASWHCSFWTLPDASLYILLLHIVCWLLLNIFLLLFTRLSQHKSNNKQTKMILWLWAPQVYAQISTVKNYCKLITLVIKGCSKALFIPYILISVNFHISITQLVLTSSNHNKAKVSIF